MMRRTYDSGMSSEESVAGFHTSFRREDGDQSSVRPANRTGNVERRSRNEQRRKKYGEVEEMSFPTLELQGDDPILHRDNLDVAPVRDEVGPDVLEDQIHVTSGELEGLGGVQPRRTRRRGGGGGGGTGGEDWDSGGRRDAPPSPGETEERRKRAMARTKAELNPWGGARTEEVGGESSHGGLALLSTLPPPTALLEEETPSSQPPFSPPLTLRVPRFKVAPLRVSYNPRGF